MENESFPSEIEYVRTAPGSGSLAFRLPAISPAGRFSRTASGVTAEKFAGGEFEATARILIMQNKNNGMKMRTFTRLEPDLAG